MTLSEVISRLGDKRKKKYYILYGHYCQSFAIEIIKILDIESRYKSWYNRNMQNHRFLKLFLFYLAYAYRVTRELARRISNYDDID